MNNTSAPIDARRSIPVPISEANLEIFFFIANATGRRFADLIDSLFLSNGYTLSDLSPVWKERYLISRAAVGGLTLKPISLAEANEFIATHHRHHVEIQGHKYSVGVVDAVALRGVAVAARPVARHLDDGWTLELRRLATDGTVNAPSMLLGAVRRAAKALGYRRLITYTLPEEGGGSLRASGWTLVGQRGGGSWNRPSRPRQDRHPTGMKWLWSAPLADTPIPGNC
jgi:hypothetical protein